MPLQHSLPSDTEAMDAKELETPKESQAGRRKRQSLEPASKELISQKESSHSSDSSSDHLAGETGDRG